MEVVGLWRHPVKSLQGERLETARLEQDGVEGDRRWGIRDDMTGLLLTARRRPELLAAGATYDGDRPRVTLPDGRTTVGPGHETDALLSDWLGHPVSLVASAGSEGGRAEFFADATDDTSEAIEWTMPHDTDIFRTLARHHGGLFGVWCQVVEQAVVSLGDRVEPEDAAQETAES